MTQISTFRQATPIYLSNIDIFPLNIDENCYHIERHARQNELKHDDVILPRPGASHEDNAAAAFITHFSTMPCTVLSPAPASGRNSRHQCPWKVAMSGSLRPRTSETSALRNGVVEGSSFATIPANPRCSGARLCCMVRLLCIIPVATYFHSLTTGWITWNLGGGKSRKNDRDKLDRPAGSSKTKIILKSHRRPRLSPSFSSSAHHYHIICSSGTTIALFADGNTR
ncbi:hypothetical protein EJ05DRAFT_48531 [Pseudovirgaria hyperparasitica]|uniref:Uncharacterized protein n=1 Tax=Pseudovirgaria hyperparasitica TaxID=470096 RepID=A0A6A6W4H9_9PEZI|nr:uncharacterized protein EJ05DRAFT_48531 [Pseudovirgaria hyperparasitica]KAF2756944.1 hypothetical protein EJ05DRAFT_48531 [Pseudovirgaria hyperparasitica]